VGGGGVGLKEEGSGLICATKNMARHFFTSSHHDPTKADHGLALFPLLRRIVTLRKDDERNY
jgi:hypothetical protein